MDAIFPWEHSRSCVLPRSANTREMRETGQRWINTPSCQVGEKIRRPARYDEKRGEREKEKLEKKSGKRGEGKTMANI